MEQLGYLLALHRRCKITRPRYQKLKTFFAGDWQKVYGAKLADWQAAGLDPKAIDKFFSGKEAYSPKQEVDLLQACGAELLTLENPHYPQCWQHIAQPPALLFARGNVENLNTKSLSVVGSRRMTDYGSQVMQKILRPVFSQGVTVVSGLAFGVDAAAHKLALDCQAPTVAVLGSGIDHLYPTSNATLGQKILEAGGAVVSEYLPQTEVRPEYFPTRNRLVAGLGQATVVVEAALKSGSLITAGLANDFGRDVWSVPGDVFRTESAGCNQLISRSEAAPLLHPQQLIETLRLENTKRLQKIDLNNEEKVLVQILQQKSRWEVESFLETLDVPPQQVNATLTLLEIKGVVGRDGNQLFLL